MSFDLLVANGLLIDGTGLPRRLADVAIRDGRVAGIGHFAASEARRNSRRVRRNSAKVRSTPE